jgi:PAS domain S-box-containing protein
MSLNIHGAPSPSLASFPTSFCMLLTLKNLLLGSQSSRSTRTCSMYSPVMPTVIVLVSMTRPNTICLGPVINLCHFLRERGHCQTAMSGVPHTVKATVRCNEQGKVIGVVGVGQDITGCIAQEREYAKLIDTANAPIFGVNAAGKVNVWNKCAHTLVGYTPEEVMWKNLVKEFITDEFKTAVQAVLDQALHGDKTTNFEFPLMTKGGMHLEVPLNATT